MDHSARADESFAYDKTGNRIGNGRQVEPGNRVTEDAMHEYEFDDEGNLIRETKKSDGSYIAYTWDQRNRLTLAEFKNSSNVVTKVVLYDYDAFNRLIRRQVNTNPGVDSVFETAEMFVYDGTQTVLVFDDSENVTDRMLWGPQVDQLFADENATSGVLWALTDNLGSVRDLVSYNAGTNTTTVANRIDYDGFGNIVSETAPAIVPLFRFTARYLDPGKQWNLNRWYDSRTGRWLSQDPIGFVAGDVRGRTLPPISRGSFPTAGEAPATEHTCGILLRWPALGSASWHPGRLPNAPETPTELRHYSMGDGLTRSGNSSCLNLTKNVSPSGEGRPPSSKTDGTQLAPVSIRVAGHSSSERSLTAFIHCACRDPRRCHAGHVWRCTAATSRHVPSVPLTEPSSMNFEFTLRVRVWSGRQRAIRGPPPDATLPTVLTRPGELSHRGVFVSRLNPNTPMNQSLLDQAVARATGETLAVIQRLGFTSLPVMSSRGPREPRTNRRPQSTAREVARVRTA